MAQAPLTTAAAPSPSGPASPLTVRSLAVAALLVLLTGAAVQQVALVYNAGEIESSVPPVPAVIFLALLSAVNPLLGRLGRRWRLTRQELITIYVVLVVSTAMSGRFLLRALFAALTCPRYYELLHPISEAIPGWVAPDSPRVIAGFYESSATGAVPWSAWLGPLGFWTAFALLLWFSNFCVVELFRRRWSEQEHLRYPLLYLPLELTRGVTAGQGTFLKDRLTWVGFGLGFCYALPVIVSPFWPNFPDWRATLFPLEGVTGSPWNELSSIYMRPLPHLIGIGYLMSSENLFTIWACYLLQRLCWVLAAAHGYHRPGWHMGGGLDLQQVLGAMIALAGWLLWSNRHAIRAAAYSDQWRPRLHLAGGVGGLGGVVWLCAQAGVPPGLALTLALLLSAESLVYARIRAEVGLPSYYALPFEFQERDAIFDVLGSRHFRGQEGLAAISRFSVLGWTTMGQFPATAAYHIENVEMARRTDLSSRSMLWLTIASAAAGLLVGYWIHLRTFYSMGALSAVGAGGDGYYEIRATRGRYAQLLGELSAGYDFRLAPNLFRVAGGVIVLSFAYLRGRYLSFPFTPWAYVIASAYGTTFWTSFLITWIAQKLILRYGGARAYRRAIPLFLGISLGYMAATVAAVGVTFGTGKALSFNAGKRLYFDI